MDDLAKRGARDASRINLDGECEVRYWMEALGVDEHKLREAVKAVGNSAAAVRKHPGDIH